MIRAMPFIVALALMGCTRAGSGPGSAESSSNPGGPAAVSPAQSDPATAGTPPLSDEALQSMQVNVALDAQDCIKRTAAALMHVPLLNGEHIDKQTIKDQLTLRCGQAYIDWATQHQIQQAATSITQVDEWEELAYDNELAKDQ